MAIVTSEILGGLRTTLKGEFRTALAAARAKALHREVCTEISSGSASNTYAWLGSFPQMREWIGDRVIKDLSESAFIIMNKLFESTLGVSRTDIEDDNLGQYRVLAQSMGQEAEDFRSRFAAKLMKDGFSSLCYDGQFFFDTDHPVYPNTDGTGEAGQQSNVYGTGSGAPWFLLSLDRPLKPFILQNRTEPEFTEQTTTQNDAVFMKDKYLYGVRWRGNFGYGLWQQAVGSKAALTASAFEGACTQMQQFRRDGGDPLGIIPTHLVVPPSLQADAEKIVKAQLLPGGESNLNYNRVTLLVSPWLA